MPYITCKDGRTYSRYDQSPYVKECIACEKQTRDSIYNTCTIDPYCNKMREKYKEEGLIVCGFLILGVVLLASYLTYLVNKE